MRKALLLSKGRILAYDYTFTNNPEFIVKVLTEIKEFDLALDIAFAH